MEMPERIYAKPQTGINADGVWLSCPATVEQYLTGGTSYLRADIAQRRLDEAVKELKTALRNIEFLEAEREAMVATGEELGTENDALETELTRLREEMKDNVQPRVLYRYLGAARKSAEKWDGGEIINILRQTLWARMIRQTTRAQRKEGQ